MSNTDLRSIHSSAFIRHSNRTESNGSTNDLAIQSVLLWNLCLQLEMNEKHLSGEETSNLCPSIRKDLLLLLLLYRALHTRHSIRSRHWFRSLSASFFFLMFKERISFLVLPYWRTLWWCNCVRRFSSWVLHQHWCLDRLNEYLTSTSELCTGFYSSFDWLHSRGRCVRSKGHMKSPYK